MDLSRVYHQVLDIVVGDVLEKHADWQQLGTVVRRDEIRNYSQAVGQQLRGELMLSTARTNTCSAASSERWKRSSRRRPR